MSKKPNHLLAQYEARLEATYKQKLDVAIQMGLDAGMMAAHDALGMGPGRAAAFRTAYINAMNEMSRIIVEDSASDKDIEYARDLIDRRLKSIAGEENFRDWDERYRQGRE